MPILEYERSDESTEMARIGSIGAWLQRFMVFTSWQLHVDQRAAFIRELRNQHANFGEAIDELQALFGLAGEKTEGDGATAAYE